MYNKYWSFAFLCNAGGSYDPVEHQFISAASYTTYALALIARVLHKRIWAEDKSRSLAEKSRASQSLAHAF